MTPDSRPISMDTSSIFPTTQENQKTHANTFLNPFSPSSLPIAISNDSISSPEPVTTTLAYEHRDSTWGLSIQPGLNNSDSEASTITDTLSNNMSSIPTDLTNSPSQINITREIKVNKSGKGSIVFLLNTQQVPMFKTITFNHPLVKQVTIMTTVSRPWNSQNYLNVKCAIQRAYISPFLYVTNAEQPKAELLTKRDWAFKQWTSWNLLVVAKNIGRLCQLFQRQSDHMTKCLKQPNKQTNKQTKTETKTSETGNTFWRTGLMFHED